MKRFIALLLVLFVAVSPARAGADFTVQKDRVLSDSFVGFGAQFNGYLYCKPNWGEGGVNETNVKVLEQKMRDLAPQHVRIFVEIQPDSRQGKEPEVKQSVIKTIELAQRCGATVNCTLWHGPYPSLDEAGKLMADMMADFIRNHHLDAIRYVTLQNEPNGFGMDMQRYNALYRAFDKAMKANGLRDHIKIVGGDLLADKQAEWFKNLADNLNDVCDGHSVHMYRDMSEMERILARPREVRAIVDALPRDRQRPVHLTEFGFRGKREGKDEPGHDEEGRIVTDTPEYALLCGWRLVDCLHYGFVSMLHWDAYDAWYDRYPMQYGFCREAKDGFSTRPHYDVFRLFTHTAKPGWKTVKVEGERDSVVVAAMHGEKGEWTIFAANRGEQCDVSFAGLPVSKTMIAYVWQAGAKNDPLPGKPVISDAAGGATTTLAARSIKIMTTLERQ